MAGYSDGVEVRASDNSPLQLIKGQDRYIKALPSGNFTECRKMFLRMGLNFMF